MGHASIVGAAGKLNAEAFFNLLAPDFQFRADTVTLSGPNTATIRNRRGADSLVVTGVLPAPTPDILFGGVPSLQFTGTQYATSDLPGASFGFLNAAGGLTADMVGFETFHVLSLTGADSQLISTGGALATRHEHYVMSSQVHSLDVTKDSGFMVQASLGSDSFPLNVPTCVNAQYCYTRDPAYLVYLNQTLQGWGVSMATPSASGPVGTLRLGARYNATRMARMRWCETIMFARPLSTYERQIVREYIHARYGIAAPLLAGYEREISSTKPHWQLRADSYLTSGGKVTSLLDRAHPKHAFTQATVGGQVVDPTPDAALGGQLAARFLGGQAYVAPNAQLSRFLGDGSGFHLFFVVAPDLTVGAVQNYLFGSARSTAYAIMRGLNLSLPITAGPLAQFKTVVANASATPAITSSPTPSAGQGAPTWFELAYQSSESPQFMLYNRGTLVATASEAAAPDAVSFPSFGAWLGNDADFSISPTKGFRGSWAELLAYKRRLTSAERTRVHGYFTNRYGLLP